VAKAVSFFRCHKIVSGLLPSSVKAQEKIEVLWNFNFERETAESRKWEKTKDLFI
jgi:hypothetical protein